MVLTKVPKKNIKRIGDFHQVNSLQTEEMQPLVEMESALQVDKGELSFVETLPTHISYFWSVLCN